jgi:selenide, water dikinase
MIRRGLNNMLFRIAAQGPVASSPRPELENLFSNPIQKDLVLIGGGHSHVHVLRSFAMNPVPGVRMTLIAKDIETPYSGMLPGFIAGHYTHEECHIDLQPLARFARARLIHSTAIGLDRATRRVVLEGRPGIPYDVLSIDIGSTPDTASVPGAAEFATPLKPVDGLAARWQTLLDDFQSNPRRMHIVTVGGGAAGVEVTLAIQHHLRGVATGRGLDPNIVTFTIVTRGDILLSHNKSVQRKMRDVLCARGVRLAEHETVARVDAKAIHCESGRSFAYDQLIWGTDARAATWLADTGLERDAHGFIKIDACLKALGSSEIFACGDVASNVDHPRPKAGVFAVRQGPPLADNLRRALAGEPLKAFVPQRDFLSLISTGDKAAIASRGPWSASGRWVWSLKDRIDRTWMKKVKALPASDMTERAQSAGRSDRIATDRSSALDQVPMRCGGCGAKVGASVLSRVLQRLDLRRTPDTAVGLDAPDDAAVFAPPANRMMVQSIDFFRSFVSDPYVFGRIAANHALGDIAAMGAIPLSALAVATVPFGAEDKVEDDLYQMLRGGVDVLESAGAQLIGGHSGEGAELALGFSVNGSVDANHILRKSGCRVGDALILTKPLGTGTLFAADMRASAKGPWIAEALKTMQQSNFEASRIARAHQARAATDVTGFGLIGHLVEMLQASQTDARLDIDSIVALPGALQTLSKGISSTLAPDNMRLRRAIDASAECLAHPAFGLLFDPQTAGGLLIAIPSEQAHDCLRHLRTAGYDHAAVIGEIVQRHGDAAVVSVKPTDRPAHVHASVDATT